MNENFQKFVQLAAVNEEVIDKLQKAGSPEEAYKIASDFSGGYSYEEFVEGMKKINDSLTKANDGELSDEDLAIVAGGKSQDDKDSIQLSVSTASVVTAIASAVATAAS